MTVKLSDSQKAVVDHFPHFLMDPEATEMTIAGFAGSGKTFLVSHLAEINDKIQRFVRVMDQEVPKRKLFFTATTNKAAAVLEQMLNVEARTIHSLLALRVRNNYRTGRTELVPNERGVQEDLNNSIIFIDEASMINRELLIAIRKQQRKFTGCKVVFIGDEYQLPPVKEDICAVFEDGEHTVRLREIQRQVRGNPIIQLSAKYRECLDDHSKPWPKINDDGVHIIHYEDKHEFFKAIENVFKPPVASLKYQHDEDPDRYRVLAWSNNRVREYNDWIRGLRGLPPQFVPGEIVTTNRPLLASDDKVLAQTDSFHLIRRVEPKIMDGIKGFEIWLDNIGLSFFQPWDWNEAQALAAQFKKDASKTRNWRPYFNIIQHWADLRPIFASTVHKAQGSTYREVFVDLNNIGKNNNWREVARLTYVAITRSSHRVHIYGKLQERYSRKPVVDHMEPFKNVECLAR